MSQAVADHLRRALDLLRRDGWCQQAYEDAEGRPCVAGAIAAVGSPCGPRALGAVRQIMGHPSLWNDAPGRKFEQVEAAFLEAIERERAT